MPRILIERATNRCRVTILTARPGVVIGRKGSEIDKLKEELSKKTGKEVYVDIVEVKTAGTRRATGRGKHRVAARTPRFVPPRDEEGAADGARILARKASRFAAPAGWAARNWRAWKCITGAACRCTRCARTLITVSPRRSRVYGKLGVKCWICKGENKPQKKDGPGLPKPQPRRRIDF